MTKGWFLTIASVALLLPATSAPAEIKAYNADPPALFGGDQFTFIGGQSDPLVDERQRIIGGHTTLNDDASGTVTMLEHLQVQNVTNDFDLQTIEGPGAFAFGVVNQTVRPAPNQTGTGSTASGNDVVWGIVFGWAATGGAYCISSPTGLCVGGGGVHGGTVPAFVLSPSFDLGTWSFDAEGDYESTPYITGTFDFGVRNQQSILRGTFQGASLPALPLIGFGALALGIGVVGLRTLRRK